MGVREVAATLTRMDAAGRQLGWDVCLGVREVAAATLTKTDAAGRQQGRDCGGETGGSRIIDSMEGRDRFDVAMHKVPSCINPGKLKLPCPCRFDTALRKLLVDGPPPLPPSLSPYLRFDTALRKLLVNDPPPDLKHYITGAFIRVSTPFPEGKMVSALNIQTRNSKSFTRIHRVSPTH